MTPTFCRHILRNTRKCQSPALTGKLYCYHHARLYRRGSGFHAANLLPKPIPILKLPQTLPITPAAIQATLTTVIQALATGRIESRRATTISYALQQRACHNHPKDKSRLPLAPHPTNRNLPSINANATPLIVRVERFRSLRSQPRRR